MCGRFAYPGDEAVVDVFNVETVSAHLEPSGDVRPTQQVAMIVEDASSAEREQRGVFRELRSARWGLVPSWTKTLDKRFLLINARSETVLVKPSFRAAARRRRALIPASGYYEWTTEPGQPAKTPLFLHPAAGGVIGLAGVFEWWQVPADIQIRGAVDGWLCSVAIITRAAMDSLGHIHDRMPVVVPADLFDSWLDPHLVSEDEVDALLNQLPDPVLVPTAQAPF